MQRSGPFEGEIRLTFEPKEGVSVGNMFPLSINLISPSGDMEVVLWVKIENEQKSSVKQKKEEEPDLTLPKAVRVYKVKNKPDDIIWQDCNMTIEDVVKFEIGDDFSIEEIRINMDSQLVIREMSKANVDVVTLRNKYFASVYSHSLLLYSTLIGYYGQKDSYDLEDEIKKEVKENLNSALEFVFRFYGGFLLSFNSDLSNIDE